MAHLGTTNAYVQYHAVNSKEHMVLMNAAITNFKYDETFSIDSKSAHAFAEAIEELGQRFAYNGLISRVPTGCDFDAADANIFTFRDKRDIISSWNVLTEEDIQKNATMTFGNRTFTVTPDASKDLVTPSQARGEVNAANLTIAGKKLMLQRFQSTILAAHCLKLVGKPGRDSLRIHRNKYEWQHPDTGELVQDGLMILFLILKRMRPSVMISVHTEISKMREILPTKFGYDISNWNTAMEAARIQIELKVAGAYSDQAYMFDYLTMAAETPCKSFAAEVGSLKTKWQLGTDATLTPEHIRNTIEQMYTNYVADGTWKRELEESSQVIALATKIDHLEKQLQNTVALATAINQSGSNPNNSDGNRRSQKQPYTVKPWRLEFKGPSREVDGKTWHWCTGDHYSGGKVHNGMYSMHETKDHDTWRKEQDERNSRSRSRTPPPHSNHSAPAGTDAEKKKLALGERLRTALTTHAGLSSDAYSKIWDDACKDSGNA